MDGSDLFDFYGSDADLAKARADAMGRRAQGMQGAGLVLRALTGDRDPSGGALLGMGQHDLDRMAGAIQHGASTRIQEKHLGIQEQQMENMLRHQQTIEAQGWGRQDLGQQRIDAMNNALRLRGIRYNANTGQMENVASQAGVTLVRPAAKRSGPLGADVAPTEAAPADAPPDATSASPSTPRGTTAFPAASGKILDKRLKDLGADFNPSSGRSGEFGKNQARVNAANRILALALDENGQPRDLNPQQMPELSQSVASLISNGGQGAQAQIEHLTPKTMSGDWAKIAQWLTNEPHGAGQQAFAQNMIETAKREAAVAQQGIDTVRGQLAQKHQAVLRGNPEAALRVLQGFGWDLGPDGTPMMKGAATKPAPAGGSAALRAKYGL